MSGSGALCDVSVNGTFRCPKWQRCCCPKWQNGAVVDEAPRAAGFEQEWQFDAVDLRPVIVWLERPRDDGVVIASCGSKLQTDLYIDSPDRRFHAAGVALRIRKADTSEATLKSLDEADDSGLRVRREITETISASSVDALLAATGEVGRRVNDVAGRAPLIELFRVRTRRTRYDVGSIGTSIAEIVLDETTIRAEDGAHVRLRRVEVEAHEAVGAELAAFVDAFAKECGLHRARVSKYEVGLLSVTPPSVPFDLGPRLLSDEPKIAELALVMLRGQVAAMLAAEPVARLGDDMEGVHRMRVAVRRIRAAVAIFAEALPPEFAARDDDFAWIGDVLGVVRDLDVQIDDFDLRTEAELGPLRDLLFEHRAAARTAMIGALDSRRYETLVRHATRLLRTRRGSRSPPATAALPALMRRAVRRVRKAGTRATAAEATPEDLHVLRKRCRRLRYALEFVAPLYPGATDGLVKRLVRLQDLLGGHQDAVVAIGRLHDLAVTSDNLPRETVFAMGRLAERRRERLGDITERVRPALEAATGKRWKRLRKRIDASAPDIPTNVHTTAAS